MAVSSNNLSCDVVAQVVFLELVDLRREYRPVFCLVFALSGRFCRRHGSYNMDSKHLRTMVTVIVGSLIQETGM